MRRICTLLLVVLAACHESEDKKQTQGRTCTEDDDCLGAFPELVACERPVCSTAGVCEVGAMPDGTACRDGLACTSPDYCLQGHCTGAAVRCVDNNPCTLDECDDKTGCEFSPQSGATCDDLNACTDGDRCVAGDCEPGAVTAGCCRFDGDCDDGDPCSDDECSDNGCTHSPSFAPCDDRDPCTGPDHCDGAGGCTGSGQLCEDGNPCTLDTCAPATGLCSSAPAADGTLCEDGNPCTTSDHCEGALCLSGASTCECTTDAECAAHEDADLCNGTLVCVGLSCVVDPLTVVACNPTGDTACVRNTCDQATGQCVPRESGDGAACDDQNPCTGSDQCQNGLCFGTALSCDDQNPCTFDACSPLTGCTHNDNNLPCSDGTACTANDQCAGGTCTGTVLVCDDQNPCTDDTCDAQTGCKHTANTAACEDGDSCTAGDSCAGGTCRSGASTCACQVDADCISFDDGNLCNGKLVCRNQACVVDAASVVTCNTSGDSTCRRTLCVPATGLCVAQLTPNGTACSDGTACTLNDACSNGNCTGAAVDCDDDNPCTNDSCDASLGCRNVQHSSTCDDGNQCTGNDRCSNGLCAGVNIACDDGNACTVDSCDPALGCRTTNAAVTTPCDDASACTTSDHCDNGGCIGTALVCSDTNPCTSDTCVPATGCSFPAVAANTPCDDGTLCTGGDKCTGTTCGGTAITCDDGNACTTDGCNAASGCTVSDVTDGTGCSDGNACTTPDTCQGGDCEAGALVCGCLVDADCDDEEDNDLCNGTLICVGGSCEVDPGTIITCPDPGACKTTTCVAATGLCSVSNAPNGGGCDDDDGCTVNDSCTGGVCGGVARVCNDNNACTADSCADDNCVFAPGPFEGQTCTQDGNLCTLEVCSSGACVPRNVTDGTACVDDGNSCTDDACVSGACSHPAKANGFPCADDGNACTYDQCQTGTCQHVSNDPAPVSANQCFPVQTLTANASATVDGWADCGTSDNFLYPSGATPCNPASQSCTGAIDSWPCADSSFYYDGDDTGYEFAYVFAAPIDGICTLIERGEEINVRGGKGGVIDWFILDGSGGCSASACIDYMWENTKGGPVCGGAGQGDTCSYKEFAVTAGEVFYIVADIYDGLTSGAHQGYNYDDTWSIEIDCRSGESLLLFEDFNDATCNGCTASASGGPTCVNFGWHPIGGLSPSPQVVIGTSYYVGQLQNNTLLGYDCGATSGTLSFPSVALPATATACTLSFELYMDLDAQDATDCVNDLLTVLVGPVNAPGAACTANGTSSNPIGYEQTTVRTFSYDLTGFKGQSLQVQLAWSADANNNTGLGAIVDDVRLSCTVP